MALGLALGLTLTARGPRGLRPPTGFLFIVDTDGAYLTDVDGAYLIEAV